MNIEKCGFVTILGQPNAGKSTLTNLLVGGKVSIVSKKVQTTRVKTLGIVISNHSQIILLDTPGIFSPKKEIEKILVNNAWSAIDGVDVFLVLIDVSFKDNSFSVEILKRLKSGRPIFLVFNKIDKLSNVQKDHLLEPFKDIQNITKVFYISALNGDGVDTLLQEICHCLPYHPWLYPEDIITTQPEAVWAAEITREQIFKQLHEELPYEIYVEPEFFERFNNGDIKISQSIIVARDGQKGIVLGHKGARIKKIGQEARSDMEIQMECKVHLNLFVKVKENWIENKNFLKMLK
jgi:GTP-binding protein Era